MADAGGAVISAMPPKRFFACSAALALLLPMAGHGADETPAPKAAKEARQPQKPPAFPPAYLSTVQEAVRHFHTRDFEATVVKLDEADKIVPPTPMTLNMRGAIAIEQREFEKGTQFLQQALKLDPKFFPARFNLGEIPFLQKRYAEARQVFEELLADDPKSEMLLFRIFLTHLLEGNDEAAKTAQSRIRFPGDTAAYYYANAAWEFAHKNETEGWKWIQSGDWVFTREKNLYFADVLVDLGWIKRGPSQGAAQSQ